MKIESIQVPNAVTKSSNSKGMLQEDEFSKVLSQTMTVENDSTDETEDVNVEQPKLNDEKLDAEEVNPLPIFFSMTSYESKEPNLQILGGNISENSGVSDINIVENVEFIDEKMFQTDVNIMQNQADVFISGEDMLSTNENFIVEDNVIIPQEPKKESLSYIKEEFVPPKDDTIPDVDVKVDNFSNKKKSIPESGLKVQQEDKLIIEKGKEETSIIKSKDKGLQENEWINTNVREFGRTSFNSKISTLEPELSRENMMAVNDSIIELVETTDVGDSSIMKVRLYPKELGTVNVTLKMEEGKLIAKILVDSDYVKQLFTGKLNELNENLIKQNIYIEKVDIDLNTNLNQNLNSNSNSSESFNQNSRKHFNRIQTVNFVEKPISGIMVGKVDVGLGTISILA